MADHAPRTDKAAPPEQDTSHIPYVVPEPQAAPAGGLPTISTLPPISAARPPAQNAQASALNHHHTYAQGNIPVVNGVRQPAPHITATQPQYAPTVVNLSQHNDGIRQAPPPPFFEYMDKCRYAAGFMLGYYVCTFLFLQPFFLGVMGIVTGFLGYYGARPPIFTAHVKWIRGFIWMNVALIVMNVWYAAIMVFFLWAVAHKGSFGSDDDGNVGGGDSSSTSTYDKLSEQHLGIFIIVVIVLNLALHVRGVRTARCFYAEMLRAGPLPGQRTVIVLGGNVA